MILFNCSLDKGSWRSACDMDGKMGVFLVAFSVWIFLFQGMLFGKSECHRFVTSLPESDFSVY